MRIAICFLVVLLLNQTATSQTNSLLLVRVADAGR